MPQPGSVTAEARQFRTLAKRVDSLERIRRLRVLSVASGIASHWKQVAAMHVSRLTSRAAPVLLFAWTFTRARQAVGLRQLVSAAVQGKGAGSGEGQPRRRRAHIHRA